MAAGPRARLIGPAPEASGERLATDAEAGPGDSAVPEAPADPALPPRSDFAAPVPTRAESAIDARGPVATAHQIASQIAPRLAQPEPGGFDIALDPQELGKVRLTLLSQDGGSLLVVQAERPETLDLMRRHIAVLEQDLRAMGHDQLSLRFAGGGAQGQPGGNPQGGMGGQAPGGAPSGQPSGPPQGQPADTPPPPARHAARDHLDLRL